MARLSDIIEDFIKSMIQQSEGELELQRNELADYFNCAPSQINYVLATRFSVDHGYHIESRRGGGGFIRIIRLDVDQNDYLLYLITERIGTDLTQQSADALIINLREKGIINDAEAVIMTAAVGDKTIGLPSSLRNTVRANIFKAMLTGVLSLNRS
jgi:transcriptional regulator CtsR